MWFGKPRAQPGPWYSAYFHAFKDAHPNPWSMRAGHFMANDDWSTSDPEWDRQWFQRNGMRPPRMVKR